MAKPLVILGTHWLAEEMYDLISEMPGYEVAAFVENMDRKRCEMTIEGLPVIWVDDLREMTETHEAICALGSTHRHRFIEDVAAMGMPFATIVHHSARVSARAGLGTGCFISPQCTISTRTELGDHVFVNRGALIGHHVRIARYVSIMCGVNIGGLAEIGEGTYVGMSAVILDRVKIGKGCVVGAGAVVTQDVPNHVQVVGVPARVTKTNIEGK